MAKKYNNIPVSPDTYAKVALLAEANGLGDRGLGAQIEAWVKRELPECDHKKEPVSIEYAADASLMRTVRAGLYCAVCNRVYAVVGDLSETKSEAGQQGRGKDAFVPRKAKKDDKIQKNIEKVVALAKARDGAARDVVRTSPKVGMAGTKIG